MYLMSPVHPVTFLTSAIHLSVRLLMPFDSDITILLTRPVIDVLLSTLLINCKACKGSYCPWAHKTRMLCLTTNESAQPDCLQPSATPLTIVAIFSIVSYATIMKIMAHRPRWFIYVHVTASIPIASCLVPWGKCKLFTWFWHPSTWWEATGSSISLMEASENAPGEASRDHLTPWSQCPFYMLQSSHL